MSISLLNNERYFIVDKMAMANYVSLHNDRYLKEAGRENGRKRD